MHQCTYLIHVVGNRLVHPEATKLEAVQTFPIPATKTDVRTFLSQQFSLILQGTLTDDIFLSVTFFL